MPFVDSEGSGVLLIHRVGKVLPGILLLLLPLMDADLEAQIPTEQELIPNGQMTGVLEEQFLRSYGPDQRVFSGIRYINNHKQSKGHKFLGEDQYQKGILRIDNRVYQNLILKYDIYNQQILLLYSLQEARPGEIIIKGDKLDGFSLGEKVFDKYYFPETDTAFFQVFEGKQVTFLYHWKKDLIPVVSLDYLGEFSKLNRISYIQIDSTNNRFRNKSTFLDYFPEHRKELKRFLRKRRMKIRQVSDSQIWEINDFVNEIMYQNSASQ